MASPERDAEKNVDQHTLGGGGIAHEWVDDADHQSGDARQDADGNGDQLTGVVEGPRAAGRIGVGWVGHLVAAPLDNRIQGAF